MTYTTISVLPKDMSVYQRDFLIKSGFAISGSVFMKSVKSSDLHIVLNQLASKSIQFRLELVIPSTKSKPCVGCKK